MTQTSENTGKTNNTEETPVLVEEETKIEGEKEEETPFVPKPVVEVTPTHQPRSSPVAGAISPQPKPLRPRNVPRFSEVIR